MSDLIERAQELLGSCATPALNSAIAASIAAGETVWRLDPHVDNVVGLLYRGTNRAVVVVYLEAEDWEVDDEWLERYPTPQKPRPACTRRKNPRKR